MKIVYLYSRIVSYTEGTLNELANQIDVESIHVVYWDTNSKHNLENNDKIIYYKRTTLNKASILNILRFVNPNIVVISGWMDRDYILAINTYKNKNSQVKVVCGIDDQWKNTVRQKLGRILFKFWFKNLFDFLWVTGKPQYHYACQMGYQNERIISNLYSANNKYYKNKGNFEKRIVFLGRFSVEKGILNLLKEYKKLSIDIQKEWPLILIGDGPMINEIRNNLPYNSQIMPYMQNEELLNELNKGGVLCLPSNLFEMWGVVIHEAAILGYPLLISKICGAISEFLIDGYNGFSFDPYLNGDLFEKLQKITSLSDNELSEFSNRSSLLGSRITTSQSAYSLLSICR
jgi:glycosyltransferase involved in cell wall biosynthesis